MNGSLNTHCCVSEVCDSVFEEFRRFFFLRFICGIDALIGLIAFYYVKHISRCFLPERIIDDRKGSS